MFQGLQHHDAANVGRPARVQWHVAEGFGRGGGDDFGDVYAEFVAHDGHLVDEADVDGAEGQASSAELTGTTWSMKLS